MTAVIAGVLGGLAVETAPPLTLPATAVIGVVLAVVVLVGLLADQERRWRQCEQRSPALFAPDGTPRGAHVTTAGRGPVLVGVILPASTTNMRPTM